MSDLLARFERELVDDPALVRTILGRPDIFPPPPPEPERVLIRCTEGEVEQGICHGFALMLMRGEFVKFEFLGELDATNTV